jgi:two-component sensor histidine kinase
VPALAPLLICCTIIALAFCPAIANGQQDSLPLESIESAIQAATFSTHPVPVVIRGIVIFNDRRIVIEDQSGATEVVSQRSEPLALGDEVEVTGAMTLPPRPNVLNGQIRRLWGGSMPLPLSITPDQAAGGENELSLVQTMADLVGFEPAGLTGVRLHLRGGHQRFSAVLPSDSLNGELPTKSLQRGAKLLLTGILEVNHDVSLRQGDAFTLLLRTSEDIELLEPPSWWTRAHLLLLAGIGMILLLIGISGIYHVKHARYRAVAEERAGIARDIHDTLAQGFAGITLQLEAAQQMIGRDTEYAGQLLNGALQLIRHSRDESHLSIDILRSLSHSDRLDVLIRHCVLQKCAASRTQIDVETEGDQPALSFNLVNNLFRVTQEALTNALQHAEAQRVVIRLNYRKHEVTLEIEDDGKGFSPDKAPGPEQGHFGLTGIRERCAIIGATLELHSSASGTLLGVRVGV